MLRQVSQQFGPIVHLPIVRRAIILMRNREPQTFLRFRWCQGMVQMRRCVPVTVRSTRSPRFMGLRWQWSSALLDAEEQIDGGLLVSICDMSNHKISTSGTSSARGGSMLTDKAVGIIATEVLDHVSGVTRPLPNLAIRLHRVDEVASTILQSNRVAVIVIHLCDQIDRV